MNSTKYNPVANYCFNNGAALCSEKSGGKEQILQAVMLLLGELGREELMKVQEKVTDLLQPN